MLSFFATENAEKNKKRSRPSMQEIVKKDEPLSSSQDTSGNTFSQYKRRKSLPDNASLSTALTHLGTFKIPTSQRTLNTVKRALIVDDTELNRIIIKRQLENFPIQFQCDEAGDGKEAVKLFCKNHYDLVLMDIEMPIMDGYAATHAIRNITKTTIPILALTSLTTDEAKIKCYEAGMNNFLNKPIKQSELKEALSKWFTLAVPKPSFDNSAALAGRERSYTM